MRQSHSQKLKEQRKAGDTNTIISMIVFILLLFMFVNTVKSQTVIRVNYAAPSTSVQDGSSWANAYRSLQDAIENATGSTQIWVAQGIYKPSAYPIGTTDGTSTRDYSFTLKNNIQLYGGFDATETLLSQRNFITHPTILSGDIGVAGDAGDNCYHVILGDYIGSTSVLNGFTVSDGNAGDVLITTHTPSGHILPSHSGGGIFLNFASPLISNCIIKNNTALYCGGGVVAQGTSSEIINNCVFTNNNAISNMFGGGALYNYSHPSAHGTPSVNNSVFYFNSSGGAGGAIYTQYADMTITNCTVVNNKAMSWGGGIYNEDSSYMTVRNSIMWGNRGNASHAGTDAGLTYNTIEPNTRYSLLQSSSPYSSNITGNPLFVNQANGVGPDGLWFTNDDGLRLSGCSPALDAGQTNSLTLDIMDNTRPTGAAFDMGAYEGPASAPFTRLYVDAAAAGGSGNSWATAINSLETALAAARTNPCINEVWVKNGVYYPSQQYSIKTGADTTGDDRRKTFYIPGGVAVYGGFAGTETSLSARPVPLVHSILSGDIGIASNSDDNCYHVVMFKNANGATRLDGFKVINGNANNSSTSFPAFYDRFGGGVSQVVDGRAGEINLPRISNCIFEDNAAINGGAISSFALYGATSAIDVSKCNFKNNGKRTVTTYGGAIYSAGFSSNGTGININESVFTLNYAVNGGAVFTSQDGDHYMQGIDVLKSVFDENSADYGAGFMNITSGTAQNHTLFSNCVFTRNKCVEAGGAVYSEARDTSSITTTNMHTTYFANANRYGLSGMFTVKSDNANHDIQYINSIVRFSSPATVVAGGTATSLQTITNSNMEGYGSSGAGWLGTSFDADGGGNIDLNPLFVNTGDLDGPDDKWATADDGVALQATSPCVNTGNNTLSTVVTDITGVSRPIGAVVDMGAYENNSASSYIITASTAAGGIITPAGTVTVAAGGSRTYTITPNTNYCIEKVFVDGVAVGSSSTYTFSSVSSSHTISAIFTARVTPTVSISTARANNCVGNAVIITATATNGGTAPMYNFIVDGASMGISSSNVFTTTTQSAGNHRISCTLTANNICQTTNTANSSTIIINIGNATSVPPISGTNTACTIGSTTRLFNAVSAGVWSSSDVSVASVNPSSGVVAANGNGLANIFYTYTNTFGCVSSTGINYSVSAVGSISPITGPNTVCAGSSITLNNATPGGIWSTASVHASINATGLLTGNTGGSTSAQYTVTNSAGCSTRVIFPVTVYNRPPAPDLAYAGSYTNPRCASTSGFRSNTRFGVTGLPVGGSWSFTGAISSLITLPGGVAEILTSNTPGNFSFTYTYSLGVGCQSSRTYSSVVYNAPCKGTVNSNTATPLSFTLYPNPAHNIINVKVDRLSNGNIIVTDLYGKTLKTQMLNIGTNTIDVSSFAKGMYFVSVVTEQGKQTEKVVIE